MCGIFYINDDNTDNTDNTVNTVNDKDKSEKIKNCINTIKHRGPDNTNIINLSNHETLGFHRLVINGLNSNSDQPMTLNNETYLLCNGEIYNHEILAKKYDIQCTTGSDCEIILHMYKRFGFDQTIEELDGEFAIILVTPDNVYVARDPYGVRALYIATDSNNPLKLGLSSECKALYPLFNPSEIRQFEPGSILHFNKITGNYMLRTYYNFSNTFTYMKNVNDDECIKKIKDLLINSVKKRIMCARLDKTNNAPAIGAYLSGGFDSSAIASILQRELKTKLETFSIGFKGSPDLFYAQKVADFIGSNHHEYIITEQEALETIPEVIRMIETYDITTIRASTMMYLLSKYIKRDSNVVVMLSGEGSDEASGSYRYFHNAPNATLFHEETERLLKDLCYFDNLRADKSSAAWGLEIRVPFLDVDFLKYYMNLPSYKKTQEGLEKYLLRKAMIGYLPNDVLYRPKEAMSDGVSQHGRSWSTIIQSEAIRSTGIQNGIKAEKELYLSIFRKHYAGCDSQIPYYWLPKWCGDVEDPSARVLSIYNATI